MVTGDWGRGVWELHMYYWDEKTHIPHYELQNGFALADKSDDMFAICGKLAKIGLVLEDLENAWECCVVGNRCKYAWQLHAPALLLLMLP